MTEYFSTTELSSSVQVPLNIGYDNSVRYFADINGDGKADFCRQISGAVTWQGTISCALATTNGFSSTEYTIDPSASWIDVGYDNRIRMFADVNGDDRADFCRMVGTNTYNNPIRPSCLLSANDPSPSTSPQPSATSSASSTKMRESSSFSYSLSSTPSPIFTNSKGGDLQENEARGHVLDTGEIAGIAIGGVVAFTALIGFSAYAVRTFCWQKPNSGTIKNPLPHYNNNHLHKVNDAIFSTAILIGTSFMFDDFSSVDNVEF